MVKKAGLPNSMRFKHDYHLVDEIAKRTRTPIIRNIPTEKLVPNEFQPRRNMGDLMELTNSIREKGILEPIIVKPKNGNFEIIAGERRYRAGLEAGLKEIPCIEYDVPDNEALELSIIENIQRKDLDVFEEAYSLKSLSEIYGYTHEEIAQKISKSRVTVTEIIRITDLPAETAKRCQELGIASRSFLLELVKLESPEKMEKVLDEYSSGSFSREEIKNQRKQDSLEPPMIVKAESKGGIQRFKKYNFTSDDKKVKIRFTFKSQQESSQNDIIQVLEKLIQEIREGRIAEFKN
jgi:ParB family transcriptional regulator, chromosome partitioning protein